MKQPVRQRPKYRLSPGEVEQLKKEETERRRKLRLVQVREQSKAAAAKIRNHVKEEKDRQILKLAQEIQTQLEEEKEEQVRKLEKQYENTLRTIGQAHSQAQITDKSVSHAEQLQTTIENQKVAEARHKEALRKLALDKAYKEYDETKHVRDRHAALEEEKKRAAEVASRPPPPPDPVAAIMDEKRKISKLIPLTDVNAFSTTHYHIPEFAVERAPPEQQFDAKSAGEVEDERTKDEISTQKKKQLDQLVRARIRGNEALKKEKLKHDYDALMADLSLQQKVDRRHRQKVVDKLPKQVFLPPDRRLEEKDDRQLEMERAFEDMYMQQINLSGNLSLTLDPNPLPQTPAEKEEDAMVVDDGSPVVVPTLPPLNPALRELTNISRSQKQPDQQEKPESVLKKLMNRIKEQRSEVEAERSSRQADFAVDKKGSRQPTAQAVSSKAKPSARGPRAPSPVQPDPQLDLSPLRAAGNRKPPPRQREEPPESEDVELTDATEDSETHFLDTLKGRLDALEVQKEYLDQRMKERQEIYQQRHQPSASYVSTAASQPPQQPATVAAQLSGLRDPLTFSQRSAIGNIPGAAERSSSAPVMLQTADLLRERDRAGGAHTGMFTAASSSVPRTVLSSSVPQTLLSSSIPYTMPSSSVPYTLSQPVPETGKQMGGSAITTGSRTNLLGGGIGQGGDGFQFRPGFMPARNDQSQSGGLGPYGSVAHAGFQAMSQPQPFRAESLTSTFPHSSLTSHMTGRQFQPLSTSLSFSQTASVLNPRELSGPAASLQQQESTAAPETIYSSLAARLASGMREDDRLRQVREYQRHLLEKHEERMRTLAEARARIENRPTDGGAATSLASQSLLSASGRGMIDPATLVPYTLRTSIFQPESVSTSAPQRSAGPSASGDTSINQEPILAGSHGMKVPGDTQSHIAQEMHLGARSAAASDWGDRGAGITASSASTVNPLAHAATSAVHSTGGSLHRGIKLDTVRKSLPFDDPDETLHNENGDGDTDGISMADDSHLSSSTDRGSPALGFRSNKSSASGLSGSLGSGRSGQSGSLGSEGSLGGSSLVARAEEKRISFEQRQRELQGQLAEIQRQKDALLQRYHGNQQKVSAQEDNVRSKLRAAQAATSHMASKSSATTSLAAASRPNALNSAVASALTSSLLPSASPSMELEEGSLSSERLGRGSGARSWAMELEEFSLAQDKNGDRSNWTPGNLTLEEISIMSEREWGSAGKGQRSDEGELRPSSSLSSLQEVSIVSGDSGKSGRAFLTEFTPAGANSVKNSRPDFAEWSSYNLSAAGSQENLTSAKSGKVAPATSTQAKSGAGSQDRVATTRNAASWDTVTLSANGKDVDSMLQDLGRAGAGGAGLTWSDLFTERSLMEAGAGAGADNAAANASRLPPPPTRQPIPVTEYEPHELSTILEVDTPQTGTKTFTTAGGGSPSTTRQTLGSVGASDSGEKSGARRFINFGSKHTATSALDDDRDSKFSASGSSASSDVRSVIEVIRPGVLRAPAAKPGVETERGESGLTDRGDFNIAATGFTSIQHGQDFGGFSFQPKTSDSLPGSQDTTLSSARSFQPLPVDVTLGSLTPRSLSMEDSRARRYLDFSGNESGGDGSTARGFGGGLGSFSGVGSGDTAVGFGRGGPGVRGDGGGTQADEVLRQARQFNQDLMAAIQRQAANVFDQSSLSMSRSAADASQESGL